MKKQALLCITFILITLFHNTESEIYVKLAERDLRRFFDWRCISEFR